MILYIVFELAFFAEKDNDGIDNASGSDWNEDHHYHKRREESGVLPGQLAEPAEQPFGAKCAASDFKGGEHGEGEWFTSPGTIIALTLVPGNLFFANFFFV